jgi:hypothetical protein
MYLCLNCRMFGDLTVKHREDCPYPVVVRLICECHGFSCNKCGSVFLASRGRKPYQCEVTGCRGEYTFPVYTYPKELRGL